MSTPTSHQAATTGAPHYAVIRFSSTGKHTHVIEAGAPVQRLDGYAFPVCGTRGKNARLVGSGHAGSTCPKCAAWLRRHLAPAAPAPAARAPIFELTAAAKRLLGRSL